MAKLILSGYLPAADHQGVTALYDKIVERFDAREPAEDYMVVCRMRAHTANVVLDGDEPPPITMRILAAEVLRGEHADEASVMLRTARDRRLGPTMIAANGTDLDPDVVPPTPRPVENVELPEPGEPGPGDADVEVPPGGGAPAFTEPAVESAVAAEPPAKPAKRRRGRAAR